MLGYQVKQETFSLGTSDFHIRSLLNNQQFFDPEGLALAAGVSESAWPLFGLVWPSARILAELMQTQDIAGKRILEMGCGLALASLVLHRRQGDITASDCHPLAASFLCENLRQNQLPALKYQTGNWERHNPELGLFDLIIASDVLYERNQPETLSQFIQRHATPQAMVIIVDPDRNNRRVFCQKMSALGFVLSIQTAARTQRTGEPYKGHILTFQRSGQLPLMV